MTFKDTSNADLFQVLGSMTVINNPQGNSGNVNIQGNLTASGTTSLATLSASLPSGMTLNGGLVYDLISGSTNAPTTASSQSLSAASGIITMTSGVTSGTGPHVIYVSANTTTVSAVTLSPTASASTSGAFQNGVEITVVNLAASGSRVQITVPGSLTTDTILISGGHAVRFIYVASAQTWIPLVN